MAEKIPSKKLEETIATLELDDATAQAMRDANQVPEPEAPTGGRRRGFGAPAQDSTPLPRGI